MAEERQAALKAVGEVMQAATYATFITTDAAHAPQARLVYPGPPANDYGVIYISTNPSTRKVAQLRANPASALSYTAKDWQAYVTLIGSTSIIDDPEVLRKHWREDLLVYYAGGPLGGNFVVLEFKPQQIEIVSYHHAIATDPDRWQPMVLRREGEAWQVDPRSLQPKQQRRKREDTARL
ncbi:pyridoxamine 5'phosphate oxidase family superfamily protein [Acanthamoeba castellanii str. Neff]|uniref:Pyridoxamine 5'phosphate oxidase family superfamily protein n=1 Tax=Acanthamoeba castellanii (strain ATCC 30010 / Neff) TaxID=1257118 RepID=L8HL21_ACACF|nr:pyridoxamine 5'phosphate oxidase family superfamily protein [Acanthamoeba castellanii str. Neff]ELR25071.1 pyridoxamine 5'phosphate oxidase family superfamily protein [Acanthamoeba castellanii str. Neff]